MTRAAGRAGTIRSIAKVVSLAAIAMATGAVWLASRPYVSAGVREFDATAAHALVQTFPRTPEYDFIPPEPGSYVLPLLKPVPDGSLLDHTGRTVSLNEVLGDRISLISFVYLTCGDQNGCPLAMSVLYDIEHVSRSALPLARRAQLVTISFDPVRDPPAALAALAEPKQHDIAAHRVIPWRFLTGTSEADMAPLLQAFRQPISRRPDSTQINHLLRLYLVDAKGHIRNIYGLGTLDPRLLMADIATLLLEAERSG